MLSFPVPLGHPRYVARAYTRRVSYRERIHGALIKSFLTTSDLAISATCLGVGADGRQQREAGRLWGYCPLIPPHLPTILSLNLLTSHSLLFVNNIYMEATPSPAERSRTIIGILPGTPCSSAIMILTEEKPVLHTRGKEGFDYSSSVRGLRP